MATFYRAVSVAEFEDIVATGELLQGPNSVEGKYLVGSISHAREFGDMLYPPHGYRIIEVQVSDVAASRLFHIGRLDNIGPAWFAELGELRGAAIREVKP